MSERPVTPITPGRFVWHELNTQDVGRSAAFYGELFGWKIDASDPEYIHVRAGAEAVAGMIKPASPEVPAHWLCYVLVEDLAATRKRAKRLSAKVMVERMAVPNGGAFSVLQDDQGAIFAVVAFGA
jgi:predicted enzyme related to lactoylglutathione lyase